MKRKKIHDRFGNEMEYNQLGEEESCIIPNANINRREDTLDDNIDHWHQIY